jgi:superfamily I DNA/RNA helicase
VVDDQKLEEFLNDYGLDLEPGSDGLRYMEFINYSMSMDREPMDIYDGSRHPGTRDHFNSVYQGYLKWKSAFGYCDFNDMLVNYCKLNHAPQFQMLAVDEAQDLSLLHWRVIFNMLRQRRSQISRVLITGDEDQSLFSYAGVDPEGMQNFAKETGAKISVLGQSYRVPVAAHTLAQRVIERVEGRFPKTYLPTPVPGSVQAGQSVWHLPANIVEGEDTIICYADKFRREAVEDMLRETHTPYESISGMPAPLQTAAGRALRLAARPPGAISEEELSSIRRGLSSRGGNIWDHAGPEIVLEKLRERDLNMLKVHWTNEEYLREVRLDVEPTVRISTIHGCKGMEASAVHVINGVSQSARDHEQIDPNALHRLFYVAVTRTSNKLFLYEDENGYDI